jgi:hypothetical protein
VLAVIALGDALAAAGDRRAAARAYGSIIDLFIRRAPTCAGTRAAPGRARRGRARAGDRHVREGRRAAPRSPDRASAVRARSGERGPPPRGVRGDRRGPARGPVAGRSGVDAVLRADAAVLAAALRRAVARAPARGRDGAGESWGVGCRETPSTSFVLTWETRRQRRRPPRVRRPPAHASYASPTMPSGGALVADVTNGYGPEMFTIEGTPARRTRTRSRPTTSARVRWATAWAPCRSSSTTARAAPRRRAAVRDHERRRPRAARTAATAAVSHARKPAAMGGL